MSIALITGSSGLVGSECVRFLHEKGFEVHGIDNNMRGVFFGDDGSIDWQTEALATDAPGFVHHRIDIRDEDKVSRLFTDLGNKLSLVIHAAAQPSHDWAARNPMLDFSINATGTLTLLEAARNHCPNAAFIFTSTNKVYGDTPNRLPIIEQPTRWELDPKHPFAHHGIDESMSVDTTTHSLFGASKLAADVMVQEYGRYFGMNTGVFRCGCITGPSHSGAELHGFLAYLVKSAVRGRRYSIFGYGGKQVRDNLHARDLAEAFWQFSRAPRPGEVYNMGGGRAASCSLLEAIGELDDLTGAPLQTEHCDDARTGDHIWWVSDVRKFKSHYPKWRSVYDVRSILEELVEAETGRVRQAG